MQEVIYPADLGRPYTEREIAEAVGMSVSQISNLRNGRSVPRADRAVALATLFGVRVEYFFSLDEDPYARAVEQHLRAIEQERHGEPVGGRNRAAGGSAQALGNPAPSNAGLLDDDQVRQIAEGVAVLPHDMRETVCTLVDQLRRAVARQHKSREVTSQ
ncbi:MULTISPECIES: helix-turn-helix transcriptional regulator [unclassified Streptomyces]|uniref:helix-turn-helix domain-containing protein n=1 Tax=unclassified Streptomyces TaxID=2593676 RepID=UPI00336ABD1C